MSLTISYHLHIYFFIQVTIICHPIASFSHYFYSSSLKSISHTEINSFLFDLFNVTVLHLCLKLSDGFLSQIIFASKCLQDFCGPVSNFSFLNLLCFGLTHFQTLKYMMFNLNSLAVPPFQAALFPHFFRSYSFSFGKGLPDQLIKQVTWLLFHKLP